MAYPIHAADLRYMKKPLSLEGFLFLEWVILLRKSLFNLLECIMQVLDLSLVSIVARTTFLYIYTLNLTHVLRRKNQYTVRPAAWSRGAPHFGSVEDRIATMSAEESIYQTALRDASDGDDRDDRGQSNLYSCTHSEKINAFKVSRGAHFGVRRSYQMDPSTFCSFCSLLVSLNAPPAFFPFPPVF